MRPSCYHKLKWDSSEKSRLLPICTTASTCRRTLQPLRGRWFCVRRILHEKSSCTQSTVQQTSTNWQSRQWYTHSNESKCFQLYRWSFMVHQRYADQVSSWIGVTFFFCRSLFSYKLTSKLYDQFFFIKLRILINLQNQSVFSSLLFYGVYSWVFTFSVFRWSPASKLASMCCCYKLLLHDWKTLLHNMWLFPAQTP